MFYSEPAATFDVPCATQHMCQELWRPMPWACLVSKVAMWCHRDVFHLAVWDDGLFSCRTLSPFDCPPDDIIHLMVALVPRATPSAATTLKSSGVHCFATWAGVGFTGFASQSMGHRNPDGFIRQPETHLSYRWCMQPISRVWDAAANSLTLSTSPAALEKTTALWFFVTGLSRAFWICCSSLAGRIEPDDQSQWMRWNGLPAGSQSRGELIAEVQMSMQLMPEMRKVPASGHCGSPALPLRQAMKLEATIIRSNYENR